MNKDCFIVRTDNNNTYSVSRKKGMIIYIHPIMDELIKMLQNGMGIDNDTLFIKYSHEQIKYYKDKLKYYINKGFFNSDFKEVSLKELKPENIEYYFFHSPQIVFEMTEYCNMKCEYCVYGENYNPLNRFNSKLESTTIKKFLTTFLKKTDKRFRNLKKLRVGFYGGEPLLCFNVIRSVVEYFSKRNQEDLIEWDMTTNATLLNKGIIDFLVKHKFRLLISLDGDYHNNSYRKLQNGNSSFNMVIKNINLIKQTSSEYFSECVRFNSVLHDKNSVPEIYQFFHNKYNKTPNIGELTTINSDENNVHLSAMRHSSEYSHGTNLKEQFDTSPQKRALLAFLRMYTDNYYDSFYDLLFYDNNREISCFYPSGTCLPFTKKIFVTAKGLIKPCEKTPIDFDLGRIKEDGTFTIDYKSIAAFYNSIYKNIWKQCNLCYGKYNCGVCFFYLKDILHSNKDIKCDNFKTLEKEKELISFFLSLIENNYTFYINCINTIWR